MPLVEQDDLVVARARAPSPIASAVRRAMRAICSHVCSTVAEPSIPSTARGRSWAAKPAIMPACVEPVTEQTTIVSKKTPSSPLLLRHLVRPAREAEAAERMVGGARGDRVRLAPACLDRASASSQLGPEADVEAGIGSSRTSAPMIRESRMLPTLS